MTRSKTQLAAALGMAMAVSVMAVDVAEARRGGSFGSRGARTYQAPPPTRTAPQQTAPVQQSMTPAPVGGPTAARPAPNAATPTPAAPRRGGFLGGLGGGLLGGLLAGGLVGMLLGHGWGGLGAGFLNALLQIGIVALGVWLLLKLFRRRQPAPAAAAAYGQSSYAGAPPPYDAPRRDMGAGYAPAGAGLAAQAPSPIEIAITPDDRDTFERLLTEVQEAFGREDYGALRARTTPEIMSYLAEELSQNATEGRRNEVSDVRLLEADVAEAWREPDGDYATCALRYESRDVMRDRRSGAVLTGDADRPTETTELWTFVRRPGDPWKLSAIQAA